MIRPTLEKVKGFDAGPQPLQRRCGPVFARSGQENDELFPAEAEELVGFAQRPGHQPRDKHQNLVAIGMTKAVVDTFEEIDVGNCEKGQGALVDRTPPFDGEVLGALPVRAPRRLSPEAFVESASVEQTRQFVAFAGVLHISR